MKIFTKQKFYDTYADNIRFGSKNLVHRFHRNTITFFFLGIRLITRKIKVEQWHKPEKTNTVCSNCKHWGGQGTTGTIEESQGNNRTCMAYLFGDIDNPKFSPMPDWVATWGSLNGVRGVLKVNKDFGCVNHNSEFDK